MRDVIGFIRDTFTICPARTDIVYTNVHVAKTNYLEAKYQNLINKIYRIVIVTLLVFTNENNV